MPYIQKSIYSNEHNRLNDFDVLEISLTQDGTYIIETRDDACELTFDQLLELHKAIGIEIARINPTLKI